MARARSKNQALTVLEAGTDEFRAACKGLPELFQPPTGVEPDMTHVKPICDACPIKKACYDYGTADRYATGVWGGKFFRREIQLEKEEQ